MFFSKLLSILSPFVFLWKHFALPAENDAQEKQLFSNNPFGSVFQTRQDNEMETALGLLASTQTVLHGPDSKQPFDEPDRWRRSIFRLFYVLSCFAPVGNVLISLWEISFLRSGRCLFSTKTRFWAFSPQCDSLSDFDTPCYFAKVFSPIFSTTSPCLNRLLEPKRSNNIRKGQSSWKNI